MTRSRKDYRRLGPLRTFDAASAPRMNGSSVTLPGSGAKMASEVISKFGPTRLTRHPASG
jgi:hypothetical protein